MDDKKKQYSKGDPRLLIDVADSVTARSLDSISLLSQERKKEAMRRFSICNTCDIYENGICQKSKGGCGCVMKNKIYSRYSTCPKDKW